jgi:hypothetical protein
VLQSRNAFAKQSSDCLLPLTCIENRILSFVIVSMGRLNLFYISNALILENSGLNRRWGGRAAMRSPAEKTL